MAWKPFSAEAIELQSVLRKFEKEGRISDATNAVVVALEKAHREGPLNISYEQFEAKLESQDRTRPTI